MNKTVIVKRVALYGTGLQAIIRIESAGFQSKRVGNKAMVTAVLTLPSVSATDYLLSSALCFGERVKLMGEHLRSDWGKSSGEGRIKVRTFSSYSYGAAALKAELYVREQLFKLDIKMMLRAKVKSVADTDMAFSTPVL